MSDSLAFSFLQKCFYMVPIPCPLSVLVSMLISYKDPCFKKSQKQFSTIRTLLSGYPLSISFVCFWHCFFIFCNISSEALISIRLSSVYPFDVMSISSWVSLRSISWNSLYTTLFFFFFFPLHPRNFLDWLNCKAYGVVCNIWTQFSPEGVYCFKFDGFNSFFL